ncbi:hypothetical protein B0H17DRAFT_1176753 [Mycena rosella]|uniref:Uncharacterized protein n=1 Tax=Mycena rosella TaxID=1033263 RepID=A0AAD7GP44_MYCRO|nr:hypothetical protein B0H17DRAFT_1176753 [Mycena rosella]
MNKTRGKIEEGGMGEGEGGDSTVEPEHNALMILGIWGVAESLKAFMKGLNYSPGCTSQRPAYQLLPALPAFLIATYAEKWARRTTDDDQEDVGHESSDKDRYLGTGIAVFAVRPLYIIMLQKNLFRRSQVNMNPNTKPVEAWQSLVISVFRSAMVGDGSASLCRRPSARHGSAAVTGDHNYLPVLVMDKPASFLPAS